MAHQAELAPLQAQIKAMTKKGGAVTASTNWTVNGSLAQGRTMVRDFSELLLRAYNAEADNLVRGLKPYKLDAAIERLTKVATTIMRLGKTMDIRISDAYHRLRIREFEHDVRRGHGRDDEVASVVGGHFAPMRVTGFYASSASPQGDTAGAMRGQAA
jgi:hypothetical protein